jgi:hypothetical protein
LHGNERLSSPEPAFVGWVEQRETHHTGANGMGFAPLNPSYNRSISRAGGYNLMQFM